jgi:hypothetical protein
MRKSILLSLALLICAVGLAALSDPVSDLFAIKQSQTASGKVELYVFSRASGYNSTIDSVVTPLQLPTNPPNFRYLLSDVDNDGIPDLLAIQDFGTSSGKIEVYELAGKNNYLQITAHYVTPVSEGTSALDFDFAIGPTVANGRFPDLFAVHVLNTTSGHPEVYQLYGSTNFKTLHYFSVTQLDPSTTPSNYVFLAGQSSGQPNLFMAVKEFNTASGFVEAYLVLASDGSIQVQRVTALPSTENPSNFSFVFRQAGEYPSVPDLVGVKEYNTASGKVELYALKGGPIGLSSTYASFTCYDVVTGLSQTTDPPNFQFAMPWQSGYRFAGCP